MEGKQANKPAVSHYITNKHAINGLTKATAYEYGPQGHHLQRDLPRRGRDRPDDGAGPTVAAQAGITYEEFLDSYAKQAAIKRLNTVEEVAAVAALLASEAGGGITGALINVDGGTSQSVNPATDLPESWITDWQRSDRLPYYTRANAGEMLPDPASPLGWTLVFGRGLLRLAARLRRVRHLPRGGAPEDPPAGRRPVRRLLLHQPVPLRVMAIRMGMTVEAFDAALLGSAEAAPPYKPHPDDVDEACSAKGAQTIGQMLGPVVPGDRRGPGRVLGKLRRSPRPRPGLRRGAGGLRPVFLAELDNAFAGMTTRRWPLRSGRRCSAELCAAAGAARGVARSDLRSRRRPSASPSWGLWQLSRAANAPSQVTALFDRGRPRCWRRCRAATRRAAFRNQFDDSSPSTASVVRTSGTSGPDLLGGRPGPGARARRHACGRSPDESSPTFA